MSWWCTGRFCLGIRVILTIIQQLRTAWDNLLELMGFVDEYIKISYYTVVRLDSQVGRIIFVYQSHSISII